MGHWGHNEAVVSCLNSPPLYYLCDRKKFLFDEVKLPFYVALIVILIWLIHIFFELYTEVKNWDEETDKGNEV